MSKSTAATPVPPPGPMEPTRTGTFFSRDGTTLYGEWFAPERPPRALVLVVHGYAEHCGRYREVAHLLTRAGLAVFTYDMRGHGRAAGQRGHVLDYLEYLGDMGAALDELDTHADRTWSGSAGKPRDGLPILLLTHSNGGLIGLRALADPLRRPRRITAAVLSSPFLGLKLEVAMPKRLLGLAAGRIAPTLSLPNELPIESLTHDPDKLAERRVDTLCHEVASAGWFNAALYAQRYVYEFAHRVDVPTLWLIAGDDHLADPETSRRVHLRLRAPSRFVELPDMYHEVMNERDRALVFGHLTGFLNERFPPS